ncbi:MAG: NnrU family protein [Hyphomicrobiaceae bacterium]|nr:NnrU family protein [Hyphomicrobiaceae bacterium]
MVVLTLGLLIFFAIHSVPMQGRLRSGLIERFGEGAYKGIFSLISAVGLVLIVLGYAKLQGHPTKNPEIWFPPIWMRHLTLLLMLPAMILLVSAYVPSRIRTMTKHPMLAAIKLWALGHLLANGDLGSIVLFGSFLAFAIVDRISLKQRHAPGPLGDRSGSLAGDLTAVVVGVALYAALLLFAHAWLFGVAPVPRLSM